MHPEAIQTMINLLLQKRTLTVVQYDALSNYLEQLKGKQAKLELGDALPVTLESKRTHLIIFSLYIFLFWQVVELTIF
jgi:hypothetical protein